MPNFIQSRYPAIDLPRQSIHALLFPPERQSSDRPAFIDALTGRAFTQAQLYHGSRELAAGIRRRVGLKRGDTMLVFSPNSIDYPLIAFAGQAAGVRVSLANSGYSPPEIAHQLSDSGSSLVFVHPSLLPQLLTTLRQHLKWSDARIRERVFTASPESAEGFQSYESLIRKGEEWEVENFDGDLCNETAYLCYSSGTTGLSKGVETTHFNIGSDLLVCRNGAFPETNEKDVQLGVLPFYHIFGLVKVVHFSLITSVPVVVLSRFVPEHFGQAIQKYRVTICLLVPPILVILATSPLASTYNLSSLRILLSGAAPLGAELSARVVQRLKGKVHIIQGYGLTETSPVTHILPSRFSRSNPASCGLLVSNTVARVVDPEGVDVAHDGVASGELWIKGPMVMKGYLNRPDATRDCMTDDGFFKTGDISTYDASTGLFCIVDRLKELIKYKGFQVPPADLEALLLSHEEIADAAVIGVYDDEQATELPRAYIVPAQNVIKSGQESAWAKGIEDWVASKVANHKKLRGGVVLIDAVPKSAAGKILRRQLRDLAKTAKERKGIIKAKL